MARTAASYHRATSYDRYAMSPHSLDWANQPAVYKTYPEMPGKALPEVSDLYRASLLSASGKAEAGQEADIPALADMAKILTLACGLTARARQPGGDFYFRSTPSAGALYPNELYLLWPGSGDLEAGLYHCGVPNRHLTLLRCANPSEGPQAPPVSGDEAAGPLFVVSGIFFRSAWKYRSRAYRYVLMDAGHLLENLRLALSAGGFSAGLRLDFDDSRLDRLLGMDPEREGALGSICLKPDAWDAGAFPEAEPPPPSASVPEASRVADQEVSYEAILEIHRAGGRLPRHPAGPPDPLSSLGVEASDWRPLSEIASEEEISRAPLMDYAEAVLRRRSSRNFVDAPLRRSSFACLLKLLCQTGRASDQDPAPYSRSVACGVLAGQVEGISAGFYLLDMENRRLGRVFGGDRRHEMTAICLNQAWLARAAVHFVILSNFELVDRVWGARGYRYAMLTAGRLGHAVYLGATALGIGCCGIGAFYDGEARHLLGLNESSAMLYLLAAGAAKSLR
jgi:SagB-type dehydrogenase family enzyme